MHGSDLQKEKAQLMTGKTPRYKGTVTVCSSKSLVPVQMWSRYVVSLLVGVFVRRVWLLCKSVCASGGENDNGGSLRLSDPRKVCKC